MTHEYVKNIPRDPSGDFTKQNAKLFSRTGIIRRIDWETQQLDVQWLDGAGGMTSLPLTHAYAGPRSGITSMPEIGSIVVCVMVRASTRSTFPVPVAYLPFGFKAGLNHDLVQELNSAIETDFSSPIRTRFRKLYPGEVWLSSSTGAEVLLTRDVLLTNQGMCEFLMDSKRRSISEKSMTHAILTAAGRWRFGLTVRADGQRHFSSDPFFAGIGEDDIKDGVKLDKQLLNGFVRPVVLPDGKRFFVVSSSPLSEGGQRGMGPNTALYVEDRLELREISDGVLDVAEETEDFDTDALWEKTIEQTRNLPFIVDVRGTLVGADPSEDLYAKPLTRRIFDSWDHPAGEPLEYLQVAEADEEFLAVMRHLRYARTGERSRGLGIGQRGDEVAVRRSYAVDVTKEGKTMVFLPASSDKDPLAKGVSVEAILEGAVKAKIGRATAKEAAAVRQLKPHFDDPVYKDVKPQTFDAYRTERVPEGHSAVITLKGSLDLTVEAPDGAQAAVSLHLKGNVNIVVDGDVNLRVTGNVKQVIEGNKETLVKGDLIEEVMGNRIRKVAGNETVLVEGNQTIRVLKDQTVEVSGDQTIKVSGDQATEVGGDQTLKVAGDQTTDVGGDQSLKVGGDQKEDIGGNREVKIALSDDLEVLEDQFVDITSRQVVTVIGDAQHTAAKHFRSGVVSITDQAPTILHI